MNITKQELLDFFMCMNHLRNAIGGRGSVYCSHSSKKTLQGFLEQLIPNKKIRKLLCEECLYFWAQETTETYQEYWYLEVEPSREISKVIDYFCNIEKRNFSEDDGWFYAYRPRRIKLFGIVLKTIKPNQVFISLMKELSLIKKQENLFERCCVKGKFGKYRIRDSACHSEHRTYVAKWNFDTLVRIIGVDVGHPMIRGIDTLLSQGVLAFR